MDEDLEVKASRSMQSDTPEGNAAHMELQKKAAHARMDKAEHWILITFQGEEQDGYRASWLGTSRLDLPKHALLKFFMRMCQQGMEMVAKVLSEHVRGMSTEERRTLSS